MSEYTVARQYAGALFTVAQRNRTVEIVRRDLDSFAQLVAEHGELREIFATPIVPPRKKKALVEALLNEVGPVSDEFRRTATLLAERDRLALVGDVARAFGDRVMDAERAVEARVVTAIALPEDRQEQLAEALGRATGRRVNVTNRIDPAILGGLVAEVGSTVFDGSVAGQLARMRQRVAADI
jgi:F-type H+-transporting ATPase subunit delta